MPSSDTIDKLSVEAKTARFILMSYDRIVVKFGTSLLTSGTDHLDLPVMSRLVEQVSRLHRQGKELAIISSGAIASGRQKLSKVQERKNTPFKQVCLQTLLFANAIICRLRCQFIFVLFHFIGNTPEKTIPLIVVAE